MKTDLFEAARSADSNQIAEAFAAVRDAAGRAKAWEALGETAHRVASGQSIKRESGFYERELRQLGRVVAWREAKVTEQRSLAKPGAIELRVLDSAEAADALIAGELEAAGLDWGYRPAGDELPDVRAHFLERERLLKAGDLAGLEAYCRRYTRRVLLKGHEGMFGTAPWTPDGLISEAVSSTDRPEVVAFALEQNPTQLAVRYAAKVAIQRNQGAVFSLLLARIDDVDAEHMDDSLLAGAVREGRADAVSALLDRKANPNRVRSAFLVRPPFTRAANDGNGPMVNAVRNADTAILRLLLAAGGDPYAKTELKRRVIDVAKELADPGIVELLQEGRPPPAEGIDMATAVTNGDIARVLELLPKEGSAEVIRTCGYSGNAPVLEAVLGTQGPHDAAALARALWGSSCNGHQATAELLLKHGADPNGHVDGIMGTARKIAEYNKHTAIAAMLKKAGAKVRVKG